MIEEEEDEVVEWCKEMAQLGHGLELIQLKSIIAQICQGRSNPFKDGFLVSHGGVGLKRGIQTLCYVQQRALTETGI